MPDFFSMCSEWKKCMPFGTSFLFTPASWDRDVIRPDLTWGLQACMDCESPFIKRLVQISIGKESSTFPQCYRKPAWPVLRPVHCSPPAVTLWKHSSMEPLPAPFTLTESKCVCLRRGSSTPIWNQEGSLHIHALHIHFSNKFCVVIIFISLKMTTRVVEDLSGIPLPGMKRTKNMRKVQSCSYTPATCYWPEHAWKWTWPEMQGSLTAKSLPEISQTLGRAS